MFVWVCVDGVLRQSFYSAKLSVTLVNTFCRLIVFLIAISKVRINLKHVLFTVKKKLF